LQWHTPQRSSLSILSRLNWNLECQFWGGKKEQGENHIKLNPLNPLGPGFRPSPDWWYASSLITAPSKCYYCNNIWKLNIACLQSTILLHSTVYCRWQICTDGAKIWKSWFLRVKNNPSTRRKSPGEMQKLTQCTYDNQPESNHKIASIHIYWVKVWFSIRQIAFNNITRSVFYRRKVFFLHISF